MLLLQTELTQHTCGDGASPALSGSLCLEYTSQVLQCFCMFIIIEQIFRLPVAYFSAEEAQQYPWDPLSRELKQDFFSSFRIPLSP